MYRRDLFQAVILSAVTVVFMIVLCFNKDRTIDDNCAFHEELFFTEIRSGIIQQKFVDTANHAVRTVVFEDQRGRHTMYLIAYENWGHFEELKENDTLSKPDSSFVFTVNGDYAFRLMTILD